MNRVGRQLKFEQDIDTYDRDLKIVAKYPTQQKLNDFDSKIKELQKTIDKIQADLHALPKPNKNQIARRVNSYRQQKNDLKKKKQQIQLNFSQKEIYKHNSNQRPQTSIELSNRLKGLQIKEVATNIHREVKQTKQVVHDAFIEVENQAERIGQIQNDAEEIDMNLSMIDQFMKIVTNRNLLTKLALILLAIFLAIADLIVLVIKIT